MRCASMCRCGFFGKTLCHGPRTSRKGLEARCFKDTMACIGSSAFFRHVCLDLTEEERMDPAAFGKHPNIMVMVEDTVEAMSAQDYKDKSKEMAVRLRDSSLACKLALARQHNTGKDTQVIFRRLHLGTPSADNVSRECLPAISLCASGADKA